MLSTIFQNQETSDNSFSKNIFWLNELSTEITESNFFTDYVRTLKSDQNQNYINFKLSDDLSQKIIHLTDESDLSIYLFLFANLNVLLHKYTGNSDIIIGSPIYPSQVREEFTNQIIPVRLNVKNQNNFKDLLCTIKEKLIAAYCNSPYPLEQLIEFLNLPQDSQRNPLFDIVISLDNIHKSQFLTETYADLHISFVVCDHSIQGKVYYNQSLFKQATIEHIIQTYLNIIEATINNINITVADIPLVKEEQKSLLLGNYRQNHQDYPVEQTIFQLFEQQVELTPNRTAAVFEHHTINYQKINESANKIARYLIELGVNQGSFVGIIKKRDINFLIAILAILKAGGVYVPIDSTYPPDRIKYMLLNSETKIVLTDASCLETLADVAENCQQLESLVCLDIKPNDRVFPTLEKINISDQLDFGSFSTNNLDIEIDGKDQAYMISRISHHISQNLV
jgi:non-ribosomal peptide synthetase component F